MLLVKGFSQTGLFRHLSDYVFRVGNFKITKPMRASVLSKGSKFHLDFENAAKNREKFVSEIIAFEMISLNCLF